MWESDTYTTLDYLWDQDWLMTLSKVQSLMRCLQSRLDPFVWREPHRMWSVKKKREKYYNPQHLFCIYIYIFFNVLQYNCCGGALFRVTLFQDEPHRFTGRSVKSANQQENVEEDTQRRSRQIPRI